jgi:hypothetical protein
MVGLCAALREIDLSTTILDINTDWKRWKDTFLSVVSEYIPKKKLKGRKN